MTENETHKSTSMLLSPPAPTNAITFSLTRSLIAATVVSQLLLAIGLILAIFLYFKTHSAIYAFMCGLVLLLAGVFAAIGRIRHILAPLRELGVRAGEVSVQTSDSQFLSGAKLAVEVVPLVDAIVTMQAELTRTKAAVGRQRDFTSDAAHELKTSVAIVKSSLQSLRHRPRSQREYEFGLDAALEDCARLEELLERMLRLARIEQASESNDLKKPGPTSLNTTCEAALSRIGSLAEERNLTLKLEAPESIVLRADPEELELIWTNLLENAVEYSPPGSTVNMLVSRNEKGMAQISVQDLGPGIPSVELPYIFERFHRGEPSPIRTTGGFGLGLAICKAVVDSYGGTIEAMNRPEGGAEIRVQLPVQRS